MTWFFLGAAIFCEVTAVLAMKLAADRDRRWYAVVVAGYACAFTFFTLALDRGLGLGVGYGIWSATGVALTALLSRVLFEEPLSRTMLAGIGLIIAGVLLTELGVTH